MVTGSAQVQNLAILSLALFGGPKTGIDAARRALRCCLPLIVCCGGVLSETSDWGDDGLVSGVCCVSWKNLAAWGLFLSSPGAAAYSIELADGRMMDASGGRWWWL